MSSTMKAEVVATLKLPDGRVLNYLCVVDSAYAVWAITTVLYTVMLGLGIIAWSVIHA